MAIVSSVDFDNVAAEIGETVTVYNLSSVTYDEDYGTIATSSLGSGTSETVIIQPYKEKEPQKVEGVEQKEKIFAMFKSNSVVTTKSIIKRSDNKMYRVLTLDTIDPAGTVHHYEAVLGYTRT